jgi:Holliday junction resolvase
MITFKKVGQTDHYWVGASAQGLSQSFFIDVSYENGEVTDFVIERADQFGTKIRLTADEVRAIVELARKLGLVGET